MAGAGLTATVVENNKCDCNLNMRSDCLTATVDENSNCDSGSSRESIEAVRQFNDDDTTTTLHYIYLSVSTVQYSRMNNTETI